MSLPKKIFLEPTTRCNLACVMCVKQSQGCSIAEWDLDPNAVEALEPVLPGVDAVIFSSMRT